MITDYEPTQGENTSFLEPHSETEFFNAKAYLQKVSKESGDNLYDHLRDLLNKILAERPDNVIDFFEEYSRKLKEERFKPLTDHLRDIYDAPGRLQYASQIVPLFKTNNINEPSTVDPEDLELADMSHCNMLELLYYLEHCGIGLPRPEMFFVMLSMKNLIHKEPISAIRFWGKVMGTLKNYLIIECELKEDEYIKRNESLLEPEKEEDVPENTEVNLEENEYDNALGDIARRQQIEGEGGGKYPRQLPPEPIIQYAVPAEPPSEPSGVGINKKVYYVCNGIGEPWIQLPDITPKHICIARQIYKSFTGNLETDICTYPEFPGKEKELLRTQIARISASTQIAPLGYYTFGNVQIGEGDEEEEDAGEESPGEETKTSYSLNPKYEPPALKDLLDGSMSFWVHHTNYILPQGRTTWWNPSPVPDIQDDEMEEEMGEEEEEPDKPKTERAEPETGPPLLTPLSEDTSLDVAPVWSVRSSSSIMDNFAIAIVKSNLWQGAYCFSTQGKIFQNVYIGFGLKQLEQNFSPAPLPSVQEDYPIGPEIMEIIDPTGIEEERWRIDHLPKLKILPDEDQMEEGASEEEVEEEEQEEED